VFDRVRENLPRMNQPFPDLLNISVNQTLSRTILTSLTTLLVVILLFIINYGQRNVMEGFSFALIVGVVVGTYSSIFIASPMLIWLHRREQQKTSAK
ncbi:MAG: protein translocase subunit SecDF, partial [Planctomycetota bacterium]